MTRSRAENEGKSLLIVATWSSLFCEETYVRFNCMKRLDLCGLPYRLFPLVRFVCNLDGVDGVFLGYGWGIRKSKWI